MPERLHPGVYIQEVPSGVRPIEGVSTSTGAFIGKTEMGALNKAVLVTSVTEFEAKYGKYLNDSWLSHSVHQFYNNGGKKCYIVRVAGAGAAAAAIGLKDRRGTAAKTITIAAASEGAWGNNLDIVIRDGTADRDNEFAILVYKDRSGQNPPLSALLLEAHDNLSMDANAANFVEKAISANSRYITATVDPLNNPANADFGMSRSGNLSVGNGADAGNLKLAAGVTVDGTGGGTPTSGKLTSSANPNTSPDADKRQFRINLDDDGPQPIILAPDVVGGPAIAEAIKTGVRALKAANPAKQEAYTKFTCTWDAVANQLVLTSGTVGTTSKVRVLDADAAATAIKLPAGNYKFVLYVNGDGPHEVAFTGPQADGDTLANAIQGIIQGLTAKRSANATALSLFEVKYDNTPKVGNPSLTFKSGKKGSDSTVRILNSATPENVTKTLKLGTSNGGREIYGSSALRPANSLVPATEYHLGDASPSANISNVIPGDDGGALDDLTFINGLSALDVISDVNILSIPGIGAKPVVDAGTNYCAQRMDCFFIGDPRPDDDTVEEARDFVNGLTVKSSYGAVYYPWLRAIDPSGASADPIKLPPSGYVAGMYARIDAKRGVWKAPAGTEANVGGAVGLIADTTDAQQDFLNPIGVNVIRSFPASGIVIWGARTLATKSDPEYRYVPVRRTAIYLEQSIYNGIQWAVFEPNDEPLWASLRLNINAFMLLQFRAGAFQGKTPNDAFFVQCDNKTTTQADIDAGIVNIRVGFAPLKPAEFVVLMLSQKVNQPSA